MLLFTDDTILQKKKTTDKWLEIKEESSKVAGYKNSTSMSTKVLHINGKLEDTIKETISYIYVIPTIDIISTREQVVLGINLIKGI